MFDSANFSHSRYYKEVYSKVNKHEFIAPKRHGVKISDWNHGKLKTQKNDFLNKIIINYLKLLFIGTVTDPEI